MRIFTLLMLTLLSYSAVANDGRCYGRKVFSCSSLPAKVSTDQKCPSYYTCRESPSGIACFQCKSSIHMLTRGLCVADYKSRCLQKDV